MASSFEGDPDKIASLSGSFQYFLDEPTFSITLVAGHQYQFFASVQGPGVNGGDCMLFLGNDSGILAQNDNSVGAGGVTNSSFAFTPSASGTYYLVITEKFSLGGDFTITVMGGNASVTYLTAAPDVFSPSPPAGSQTVVGDKGNDIIQLSTLNLHALGEQGDDTISGNVLENRIAGGVGNDTIHGHQSNDILFGDSGNDLVYGDEDNDFVYGNAGADILYGGTGIDRLFGGGDGDFLSGDEGNDILDGGAGFDTMIGGNGNDTYFSDYDRILENGTTGDDLVISTSSYDLTPDDRVLYGDIERLTLAGSLPINATGNALPNVLTGNSAANVIAGRGGADTLIGLAGNDTYVLGSEATGVDKVVDSSGAADRILSAVTRSLMAYPSIENLTLTGAAAANGTGNVRANVITGNNAINTLDGGLGNDTLQGLGGNDVLVGGAGRDAMAGGLGNDLFRYAAASQSAPGALADVIADFDRFGNDAIDLRGVFGGVLAYRHNAAFTAAGQVRINDIAGPDVVVEVNVGGSLAADMQIRLTATTLASMTASDFLL